MAEPRASCEEGASNRLMYPPRNWRLIHLVDEFCKQLSSEDFLRIKLLFKDIVTEQVESWVELFRILVDTSYITEINIVYLQKIADYLGNENLYLETLKYRDETKNDILHFEKRFGGIGPGDGSAQFHVIGHKCSTQEELQKLLETISIILQVDIARMKVANVQPENSVLIEIILPRMYVKVLENILLSDMSSRFTATLVGRGVDKVFIDGEKYDIQIEDQDDKQVIDQTKYISELQNQLSQTQSQVKKLEEEMLYLRRNEQADIPPIPTNRTEENGTESEKAYVIPTTYNGMSTTISQNKNPQKKRKAETLLELNYVLN